MKRALRLLLALLALAALLAAGGIAWLLGTESGLRWALARVEASTSGLLSFSGATGTLGGGVSFARVSYADSRVRVEAANVSARARALPLLRGVVGIEPLVVDVLRIDVLPGDAATSTAPSAQLPVGLRLADVDVSTLELRLGEDAYHFERLHASHAAIGPRMLRVGGRFRWPDARWPVAATMDIRGTLERFQASLEGTIADVPAKITLAIDARDERPLRELDASAGPAELSTLRPGLPRATLSARLNAKPSELGFRGKFLVINASAAQMDTGGVPVESVGAHFESHGLAQATLTRLRVQARGGGDLEGRGTLDHRALRATLAVHQLDLRTLRSNLRRTRLSGTIVTELTLEAQSIRGELSQEDLRVAADVRREGDVVEVRSLHARAAGGEASGQGRIRLGKQIALEAALTVARVDPAAFGDFPRADLNGKLEIDGSFGTRPYADARWTLADSTLLGRPLATQGRARFSDNRISRAQFRARYGPAQLGARGAFGRPGDRLDLDLDIADLMALTAEVKGHLRAQGALTGNWSLPALRAEVTVDALRLPGDDKARAVRADFDGTASQHALTLRLEAEGSKFLARLAGGWSDAQAWRGTIVELENAGTYPLRLLAPAPLSVARHRVALGRLEAQVATGRVAVDEMLWTPGRIASRGEVRAFPAAWLALAAGVADHVQASMLIDGSWQLEAVDAPIGHIRLQRASGDLAIRGEGGTETVPLEVSAATLDAQFTARGLSIVAGLRSRFGELALDGNVGLAPDRPAAAYGPRSPLALRARLESARLRSLVQPLITQARIDGQLTARLNILGTLEAPRVDGELRGEAISFEIPTYGVYLKDGRIDARLEGDRLRVVSSSIRGGQGEFGLSGSLPLRAADGGARLDWSARQFGVLNGRDLRLTVSGNGAVSFDGRRLLLTGELRADRGYLFVADDSLPRPGDDVVVVGREAPRRAEGPAVPLALDVQLDLGSELAIDTQTLEGKLAGRVRVVTAEDGGLRAYGRLTAVNAVFHAYSQRLLVDPGELIFDGPIDNPALSITAWRRNQAVEAGVQLTGNLKSPRVQLVSSPPVSEQEALSWLVLGRAPGEASRADLGLLQAAASALLARGRSLPPDRRLARAFGFDELTLRGAGELEGGVVAVGKRVSDRLYVSYEQGIGVVSSLVKMDYSLGRRWSLRGETGTSSGAGIFYRFAWD